ncbi:MAG: cytosine deaminase, partial [Rhodobacteraceae bacterium]|nr:cytosine deaminase [Paracoccaceae bacterium]
AISIDAGRITASGGTVVNMKGAIVFPAFTDMHTHLDKGHIWPRSPNPDGTFPGALNAVRADTTAHWSAEDVAARMNFALKSAYAHGTKAIRTHLDSSPPQNDISWPLFREIRAEWADKIALQAVCLVGCEGVEADGPFAHTADLVADTGGVLGMVSYPVPRLKEHLVTFLKMAQDRGLAVDLHVDETIDPGVETLRMIAETVQETGFAARVIAGHCCSLSTQDEARALDTLDLVAKAGIHIVSLPMCNLYLQDRHAGRTPRGRGITLVHEMKARGIPVSFASDNTRDPFYAYGDLDMLEVMRDATRIGHLDHSDADWSKSFLATPAETCGFDAPSLAPGAPADLVIFNARSWTELFARPQSDRVVLRNGAAIDRTLPNYSELDHLMDKS